MFVKPIELGGVFENKTLHFNTSFFNPPRVTNSTDGFLEFSFDGRFVSPEGASRTVNHTTMMRNLTRLDNKKHQILMHESFFNTLY